MSNLEKSEYYLEPEKPLNLQELWFKFLRRRKIFFIFAIPVFLGILIFRISRPYMPIYLSSFDLGVAENRTVEGFFTGVSETPAVQIGTVTQRIIANLLSIKIAEKVVDTLGLYAFVKEGNSDLQLQVHLKRNCDELLGPYNLKILNGGFALKLNGEFIQKNFGEYIDLGHLEFTIPPGQNFSVNKNYTITFYPRSKMALALRNSSSVKVLEADKVERAGDRSGVPISGEGATKKMVSAKSIFPGMNVIGILRIELYWGDKEQALRIARALSEILVKENIQEKSLQYIQSRQFIESQLAFYQQRLNELEEQIKNFKETKKIADLKASTQALINQVATLESRKNQLEIEEKILSDINKYLNSDTLGEMPLNIATTMISEQGIQQLYTQLVQADAELKGILKEYSTRHPKYSEIKARYDGYKEQLKVEIAKRVSTIKTDIQGVANQIRNLQLKLENIPSDEINLARLERDRETAEKLYTFFSEKLEETRVQEAGVTSDIKIINPPFVSGNPVNPRRFLLTLFLSVFFAILTGSAVVFITEYFDNTIKEPETIKEKLNLAVFGLIPGLAETESKKIKPGFSLDYVKYQIPRLLGFKNSDHKSSELKIITERSSAEFEAFRKLSVHLEFAHPEKEYRVLYITSCGPEEGKTFITLNLGYAFATKGKKVLLIDTDFRKKRGNLTHIFKMRKEKGIFNVLKDEINLEEVITPISQIDFSAKEQSDKKTALDENVPLFIMPIGDVPPNPFIFLESDKMRQMLERLKAEYNYILVDGLPLLLFADATYLARYCDGVLLVAMYNKTNLKELENSQEVLNSAHADIVGVVINNAPLRSGSYYYHYYYKYYSKYYRGKE
ncbi:MAG: polysaccharide biosynthesis tyrosine autokinase [candidate division WOR-3 bacterium]|nr:polysaccharide biosynthesis tyrosine autokinase [candidate division WOR-3 bacterium]